MLIARTLRNIQAGIKYPFWILKGRPAPDNHLAKKKRILKIFKEGDYTTFIETGTFYGQMLKFSSNFFEKSISIEIYKPLYEMNNRDFKNNNKVAILFGDSSTQLKKALELSTGKIIFWLDGHYSGDGTGKGRQTSPIIDELENIKKHKRKDHCILIDDARLFNGTDGYPTLEETKNSLLMINQDYKVYIDHDCIVCKL